MWKKKKLRNRPSPLMTVLGLAIAGIAVLAARGLMPDLFRYARMHRM